METKTEKPQNGGELVERNEKGQFIQGHTKLGGREVGSRNFITDFDEAVSEIAKEEGITASEAKKVLLKKAYSLAKEGNFPFYKDIVDRYYGATQPDEEPKQELHLHLHSDKIVKIITEAREKIKEQLGDDE